MHVKLIIDQFSYSIQCLLCGYVQNYTSIKKKNEIDRFLDPNTCIRGAVRRVGLHSDLEIYRNLVFLRLEIHKIGTYITTFYMENPNSIYSAWLNHAT